MNNKRLTTEQMLSIERWENEGGKISISQGSTQTAHHLESIRTDKLDHPEFVGQPRREHVRLTPSWSFAS